MLKDCRSSRENIYTAFILFRINMIEQALTKCLSAFFIVVTIYPIATVPSVLPMISIMKHNAERQSAYPKFVKNIGRTFIPIRPWKEPDNRGFDLNTEEIEKFKIWDKGTIPFYIDIPSFSDKSLRDRIRWFLNEVNSMTSLNFVELPRPPVDYNEERWVYFLNRGSYLGCHDISINNFTTKGVQRVVLGYDCLARGGGLAEIVLALAGVPPQHNAPDRDEYIHVLEENIIPEKKYLFKKLENSDWLFHDFRYDSESASHYHEHRHSANGQATLKWNDAYEESPLGQDQGFSNGDIMKINALYNYIVQQNKSDLPACRKLFARVVDSSRPLPSSGNLGPRRKPNLYLGIENNIKYVGKIKGGDSDKGDGETQSSIKSDEDDVSGQKTSNETKTCNDGSQNCIDGSKSENVSSEKTITRNHTPMKTTRKSLNSYKDPLSYLSDYATGDERLQRSVWRKPDYKNFGKMADLLLKD